VRAALAQARGVQAVLLDLKGEADRLYAGYLSEAVRLALAGFGAIVLLLWAALRSLARVARVVAPLALSVLAVAGLLVALGERLTILHVVGMLLIVAVGSNYALFFDRSSASARSGSVPLTLASLLVANIATVLNLRRAGLLQRPGARGPGVHRGARDAAGVVVRSTAGAPGGGCGAGGWLMMHTIADAAHAGHSAPMRVLMLPAAYSGPEDFVRAGFARRCANGTWKSTWCSRGSSCSTSPTAPCSRGCGRSCCCRRGRRVARSGWAGSRSGVTLRCAARSATRRRSTGCACSPPTWAVTS